MQLYDALAGWYHLVDPEGDHAGEEASYQAAFEASAHRPPQTLLELGAGNALDK